MNTFNHSAQRKQELVNGYEALRNLALSKSGTSADGTAGYSILLFRGMPAWINAHLSSELISPIQSSPLHSEETDKVEKKSLYLLHNIHQEAIMILTNMILSHQHEILRSPYV